MKQSASSHSPYETRYGFARATRVGNIVHVAGTAPIWPDGSCPPSAHTQTLRCLEIIKEALHEVGASIEDVTRTRMFIVRVEDADEIGRAHAEVFHAVRPAATMVVVAGLLDARWVVEIEADAILDQEPTP